MWHPWGFVRYGWILSYSDHSDGWQNKIKQEGTPCLHREGWESIGVLVGEELAEPWISWIKSHWFPWEGWSLGPFPAWGNELKGAMNVVPTPHPRKHSAGWDELVPERPIPSIVPSCSGCLSPSPSLHNWGPEQRYGEWSAHKTASNLCLVVCLHGEWAGSSMAMGRRMSQGRPDVHRFSVRSDEWPRLPSQGQPQRGWKCADSVLGDPYW